jgi:DNA polymerase-3 subunit epsilon
MSEMTDRDRAILWARQMLQQDFIILDTETTGLNPEQGDQAITIGIVDSAGVALMNARIKPTIPISPAATARHGYSNEAVAGWPALKDIYKSLFEITFGRTIVSYCAGNYDARIIRATCLAHGLPEIGLRGQTQQMIPPFADFYGEWNSYHGNNKWQSLNTAARHFGLDIAAIGREHDAVTDCLITLAVLRAMAATPLSGEENQ